MKDEKEHPESLLEAVRYFSNLDRCHDYMVRIKWPDGRVVCPKCGTDRIGKITSRRLLQCKAKNCRKQFSHIVGTIFEDSPLGLDKWFVAVWCIANCKNGISSHELGRTLGITQKSSWHVLHRIRAAMRTGTFRKISGQIESDESFVGGKATNMHRDKREAGKGSATGWIGKAIVHGLLERGVGGRASRVRAKVVPNVKRHTLQDEVRAHVDPGSTVYTDCLQSYVGLADQFVHEAIDHAVEYVRGAVHTNGLENFWSLLKRCVRGTYVWVHPRHLQRYLDEQARRFNERKDTDADRFGSVMRNVTGKRLTYAELIGAEAQVC